MKKNEIIKNLRSFSDAYNPRKKFKKDLRDFLLSEFANEQGLLRQKRAELTLGHFKVLLPNKAFIHRLSVGMVSFVLMIVSGIAALSASRGSLPGDILYPVKITVEKTQLALTYNNKARIELDMEFAGRRIEEVTELSHGNENSANKQQKVAIAVSKLNNHLKETQKHIKALDGKDAKDAVEFANVLSQKTKEYRMALALTSYEVKDPVTEAINIVNKTNTEALDIIVSKHKEAGISEKEVIGEVEDKIKQLQKRVAAVHKQQNSTSTEDVIAETSTTTDIIVSEEASEINENPEEILDEAKEALKHKDLAEAISKIKETETSINNIINRDKNSFGPIPTSTAELIKKEIDTDNNTSSDDDL